jgi:hypothetical protein
MRWLTGRASLATAPMCFMLLIAELSSNNAPGFAGDGKTMKLRFRLRTLFVFMTILAVQSAVCLPMLREWQKNQEIEEIWRQIDAARGSYSVGTYILTSAPLIDDLDRH